MPLLLGLGLLFVVVPIAELALIVGVGQAIGLWPTVGLLLADSLLGSLLLRAQGRAAWRNFAAALAAGRVPAAETVDGVLVVLGGAALLTPGFLSDLVGVALLLPPTRALVRRVAARRLVERMVAAGPPGGAGPFARRAAGGRAARPADVDSTAREVPGNPRLEP